jgi:hypothetical protein
MNNKNGFRDTFFTALSTQYLLMFSWLLGFAFGFTVGYGLYKVLTVFTSVNMMPSIFGKVIYAGIDTVVGVALFIILRRRMPVIDVKEFVSHQATRSQKTHYLIVRCVLGACVGLAINGVAIMAALAINMYLL